VTVVCCNKQLLNVLADLFNTNIGAHFSCFFLILAPGVFTCYFAVELPHTAWSCLELPEAVMISPSLFRICTSSFFWIKGTNGIKHDKKKAVKCSKFNLVII
jgi:hypothetical protein